MENRIILLRLVILSFWLFSGIASGQRRASYGEPCNRLTRCDSRAALTCQRGVCDCINPDTMKYNSDHRRCSVLVGERCIFTTVETDSQTDGRTWKEEIPCVNQASCQDGFCTCFPGFYENSNGTCVPKKDHRDDCENENACRDDKFFVCDSSKHCDCNATIATYDFQRQICVRKAGALCGDFQLCVNDAYCRGPENTPSISPGLPAICSCEQGFFANSEGACEKKRTFGEECQNDNYCQTEDYTRLVCNLNGRCGCNTNISYFDFDSNMCRRLAGASCADFPYCTENSECGRLREFTLLDNSEPTCDCILGYFPENGTCELQHRYGESCKANDNCKKGLICDKKTRICQCDVSTSIYDRVKARCVGLANSACDETENCITNSECRWTAEENQRQCHCRTGYAPSSNGSCLASYDVWCSDEWTYACNHEQGLECFEGRCACKYSDFQSFDTEVRKCVSQVNGPCDNSIPCVTNAHCLKTENDGMIPRCHCGQGFVPVNGICQLTIGQPCNYSTDGSSLKCDELARLHCLEGICQCASLQVYDHQVLKCRGLVGSTCLVQEKGDKSSQDFCVNGANCIKRRFRVPTAGICRQGWTTTKDRKCLTVLTEENLIRSSSFNDTTKGFKFKIDRDNF